MNRKQFILIEFIANDFNFKNTNMTIVKFLITRKRFRIQKNTNLQIFIFRTRESRFFVTNTLFKTKNRFLYVIFQFVRIDIFNHKFSNHNQYESLYDRHN